MILDTIRTEISAIDYQVLHLLHKRMELTLKTKTLKQSIEDSLREQEILEYVKKITKEFIEPEFYIELYTKIFQHSKVLQKKSLTLIGFMGEHGSYGEFAAKLWNNTVLPISLPNFKEVFNHVKTQTIPFGIIPIKNTIGGNIEEVNDLFLDNDISITGEVVVPIHHALLTLPNTDYRNLKYVISHPQALSQCRDFITRHNLTPIEIHNTAAAAKLLSIEKRDATAVIANKYCANLYNLFIVAENIESYSRNVTRFVIISSQGQKSTVYPNDNAQKKCSIILTAHDSPGSLLQVLTLFNKHGINLTKIDSVPSKTTVSEYLFFVDFQGDIEDSTIKKLLESVKKELNFYRFLGCYPQYSQSKIEEHEHEIIGLGEKK